MMNYQFMVVVITIVTIVAWVGVIIVNAISNMKRSDSNPRL